MIFFKPVTKSIKETLLNDLLDQKFLRKKWILEYLLNLLPQLIYGHVLKRLDKALY